MFICKTTSGKRFDFDKAEKVTSINWKQDATRGSNLYKTASGNYVVEHWTRWQGEQDTYEECSIEDAKGYVLDNMKWEEAISVFPELETDFTEDI